MKKIDPKPRDAHVFVCHGERCTRGGAPRLRAALAKALRAAGLKARLTRTSCQGLCKRGPIVLVEGPRPRTWGSVTESDAPRLAERIAGRAKPKGAGKTAK